MDFSSAVMDQTSRRVSSSSSTQQIKPTSAIMQSIDYPSHILPNRDSSLDVSLNGHQHVNNLNIPPDVTLTSGSDFQSLKLMPSLDEQNIPGSFLLLDKDEVLQVSLVAYQYFSLCVPISKISRYLGLIV